MKKLFSSLFLLLAVFCLFTTSFAQDDKIFEKNTTFSYKDYKRGIEEGWIDKEISYKMLAEAYSVTFEEFCDQIEKDPNFTLIYEDDHFDMDSTGFRAAVTELYPGDVFIMNSDAPGGYHSSLYIKPNHFLNITKNGNGGKTQFMTRDEFKRDYQYRNIKLFRSNNYNWGVGAANWAYNTYINNPAEYDINLNLINTHPTYCAKIVYQAYREGARESLFSGDHGYGIITPFRLPEYIKIGHHGEYYP